MLTATDVRNAAFSRSARGYKTGEVDDFLEQVIDTIEQLHKENEELVRKIEVLADRIQEYRNEEDSIRSALLTAQKSADKILKEANDEKEQLLTDARQQADDALRLSQEKSVIIANETRERVTLVLNDAKEKANKLLNDAKEKSDNMLTEALEGCKAEKRYLEFLKEQETTFRQQLVEMYKKQFELMKRGPELIKELDQNIAQVAEPVSAKTVEVEEPEVPVTDQELLVPEETVPAALPEESAVEFVEPEDIPLPVAANPAQEESVDQDDDNQENTSINQGFEVKRKFSDLKFGEDYDISADDDYDDYGV